MRPLLPAVHELEKAELHCHLDGLADPATLERLHRRGHPVDPAALDRVCPVNTKQDWVEKYMPAVDALMAAYPDLRLLILDDHIRQLIEQNVIYAEIMLSGIFAPPELDGSLDLVRQHRQQADRSSGDRIRVEFTCAVCRAEHQVVRQKAERAIALYEAGLICGFAIACEEDVCTIESLRDIFDRLHETGMGVEIHAGEWLGPEIVRDAIEWGRPHRIGHGVHAFRDAALIDMIIDRDIHLEFCPTSNLKTGSVDRIEHHPIVVARDRGMNFSINTDDAGPFGCSMNSEFALLERTFGFTADDFTRVLENSLGAAFGKPPPVITP